jgi:hypothetical protein
VVEFGREAKMNRCPARGWPLAALALATGAFAQDNAPVPPKDPDSSWFEPGRNPEYLVVKEKGPASTGIESAGIAEGCMTLDAAGNLTLHEGFAWSGPSWVPDEPRLMLASAYRDALYRLMRAGRIEPTGSARRKADAMFVRIAGEFGYRHTFTARRVLHEAGRTAVAHPVDPATLTCTPAAPKVASNLR